MDDERGRGCDAYEDRGLGGHAAPPEGPLTGEQETRLAAGMHGADGSEQPVAALGVLSEDVENTLSFEQVAVMLGVPVAVVEVMTAGGELYAVATPDGLRLPPWQLAAMPIPGLGEVLAALPGDLHPVEVAGWMLTPHVELADDEDERPANVRDFLFRGGNVGVVVAMARDFDLS